MDKRHSKKGRDEQDCHLNKNSKKPSSTMQWTSGKAKMPGIHSEPEDCLFVTPKMGMDEPERQRQNGRDSATVVTVMDEPDNRLNFERSW
jgi:hypothetical protein